MEEWEVYTYVDRIISKEEKGKCVYGDIKVNVTASKTRPAKRSMIEIGFDPANRIEY